ncbi:hypothetical protein Cgig2_004299 [Carnegiea gigantea]|uniref:Uncharacterized protein n=1 Tax=Carnegiea gigantea TaxID=171969 RepID=A0A9Q1QA28_9CARY|nr:hypothetical protein Cgig2_004299 [Carnegiea gigantea]
MGTRSVLRARPFGSPLEDRPFSNNFGDRLLLSTTPLGMRSREARKRVSTKNKEAEDGVEGEVEDTHNLFEDSKEAFEDATPSLTHVPPQTFEARLQMLGQISTQDTQLLSLIDQHSIKDGLDHLGNAEVLGNFLSHDEVEVGAKGEWEGVIESKRHSAPAMWYINTQNLLRPSLIPQKGREALQHKLGAGCHDFAPPHSQGSSNRAQRLLVMSTAPEAEPNRQQLSGRTTPSAFEEGRTEGDTKGPPPYSMTRRLT